MVRRFFLRTFFGIHDVKEIFEYFILELKLGIGLKIITSTLALNAKVYMAI